MGMWYTCHVRVHLKFYRSSDFFLFLDAGVSGNYGEARILVRDIPSIFKTGIWNMDREYVFNEEMPSLNVSDGVSIIAVLAWSTRILHAEVVSIENDTIIR